MSGVYVITDGEHFKIGVAVDPMKRLSELQTGNPHRLALRFFYETHRAREIEQAAHTRLANLRMVGEWFACGVDCAVWAILAFAYPGCLPDDDDEEVITEGLLPLTAEPLVIEERLI